MKATWEVDGPPCPCRKQHRLPRIPLAGTARCLGMCLCARVCAYTWFVCPWGRGEGLQLVEERPSASRRQQNQAWRDFTLPHLRRGEAMAKMPPCFPVRAGGIRSSNESVAPFPRILLTAPANVVLKSRKTFVSAIAVHFFAPFGAQQFCRISWSASCRER